MISGWVQKVTEHRGTIQDTFIVIGISEACKGGEGPGTKPFCPSVL